MEILLILITSLFGVMDAPDVRDNPNDDGSKIVISWQAFAPEVAIDGYEIWRAEQGIDFGKIAEVNKFEQQYIDSETRNGILYRYKIIVIANGEIVTESEVSAPVKSSQQWFNTNRTNVLIGFIIYAILLFWFIYSARKGKNLFIRKLAGLEALEDAVGRATEMGKPILYVPGLSTIDDIATLASLNILSLVAKKTAEYNTTLLVPNRSPVVYVVAREIVK